MQRNVPVIASEEIELYLRTYYSLLRSSAEVQIKTLEEAHAGMHSLLHAKARENTLDLSAFIYSILRLPAEIFQAELVVLGQSQEVFRTHGFADFDAWEEVTAAGRRRRTFFNGTDALGSLIASRSDIDDLIPLLTAFQIEWNKLHFILQKASAIDPANITAEALAADLEEKAGFSKEETARLASLLGGEFIEHIAVIQKREIRLRVQLLSGSLSAYRRATHAWWGRIEQSQPEFRTRRVYFVSSNNHSLRNIMTGFAISHKDELLNFISEVEDPELLKEWQAIQANHVRSAPENFLYYTLKKYLALDSGKKALLEKRNQAENEMGIQRIRRQHSYDLEAQILPIKYLGESCSDPRLQMEDRDILLESDAYILNIDYPLGYAAYEILREVSEHVGEVEGVYILGKAATLNGIVGDIMIPNVVYDAHSQNTYMFSNCFEALDISPYLNYGSVLDNQKAVSVRGTFLQNATYMDVFYREGYTDIEMEAGPYLSAIYEMFRPQRHPTDEIVNLHGVPFDLGILHYASDKPLSKGSNLGAGNMSYFGMDPTYATSLSILKRIMEVEKNNLLKLRN